jgi:hypothetical protein
VGSVDVVDAPRQRVECGEGAVVGSVGSVDVVDVPSQRGECGEGAVVGSVGSVDVVDAPSQRVECGEGAVVGSVGSVDVVDAPSERVECGEQMAHELLRLIYPYSPHNNPRLRREVAFTRAILPIVRNERIARSLNLVNTVSRTSPTKGKFLNNTTHNTSQIHQHIELNVHV